MGTTTITVKQILQIATPLSLTLAIIFRGLRNKVPLKFITEPNRDLKIRAGFMYYLLATVVIIIDLAAFVSTLMLSFMPSTSLLYNIVGFIIIYLLWADAESIRRTKVTKDLVVQPLDEKSLEEMFKDMSDDDE